jgi:transcriptional regulator with XRE-family HTH domain
MVKTAKSADQNLYADSENGGELANLIARARKKKGWSRSDLARAIWGEQMKPDGSGPVARNRYTVTTWETGKHLPRPHILPVVADALDIPVADLQTARADDETARIEPVKASAPEVLAGTVTGRPDLVRVSIRGIVPVDQFPNLVAFVTSMTAMVAET